MGSPKVYDPEGRRAKGSVPPTIHVSPFSKFGRHSSDGTVEDPPVVIVVTVIAHRDKVESRFLDCLLGLYVED